MFRKSDDNPSQNTGLALAMDVLRGVRRNLRSSLRAAMTRESLWSSIKSLAWVAPLTILIWVYAEREQIRPSESQPIRFSIRTTDPRQVVTIVSQPESTITATLRGPQQALEQVVRKLGPGEANGGAVIVLSSGAGQREVATSEIRNAELFRDAGVEVFNESPPTITVRVDQLIEMEVDVEPPPGMENFTSPPQFEPRRVTVSGPESLLKNPPDGQPLVAIADLLRFTSIRTPGRQVLPNVPLALPAALRNAPNVKITPDTAVATVDVKNAEREGQIAALPIWPLFPPAMKNKYDVKLDADFVQNVFVVGPADQVDKILAGSAVPSPKAVLEISQEDVGKGKVAARRLRIELPEGVRVGPQSQNLSIGFTVTPVGEAAPE